MSAQLGNNRARVMLLGAFQVDVGGRVVGEAAWPGRRSAELVQLLALADGHRLAREQVIEALWPHLGPQAGAAQLRKAAHHARQACGRADAVVLSGGRVALFPSCGVETDVERFERDAEQALRAGDVATCAQVASGYHGELLPDSRYEEWALGRRDRLRLLYVDLLRRSGQWERLVAVDPCDEAAYEQLIRAELAAGNRHRAIGWYGRLRTSLKRELGIQPGRESRALYEQCVAGLGGVASTFVGRQVELAQAVVALRSATRGELGALAVRGPAGIGKTALCRRLAAAARERGWRVASVPATAGEPPYAPLANVVEQLLGTERGVLEMLSDRTRSTLEELASLPARAVDGGLTRHRVLGAVRRLLTAVGDPVLVVIDDAHLADDATLEACLQLARVGGGRPFLVVLAARPVAGPRSLHAALAGLERAGRAARIELGPLEDADIVALVEQAAPGRPDAEALARIVGTAQGNPFLAVELARRATAGGDSVVSAASIRDAVAARFLDLDEALAANLRRLAVAAEDIDPADVLALTGLSEPDAFATLDAAISAGALTVSGAHYRFSHELVRQALVEQVPPHRRVAIHREVARSLAGTGAAPAAIARHWLAAGRPGEAVEWQLAAARQAVKLGAFTDALGHLEPLLEHTPEHAAACRLHAEVLDALGDSRAVAAYDRAAGLAGEPASHDIRAQQALAQLKLGDPGGAMHTLDGVNPTTARGRLCHALTLSGAAAIGLGDPVLAATKAAESRRLALLTGDAGALVEAAWAQALAAHARGQLRESLLADLRDTDALPDLAIRVFDGQLCVTQRLLYGGLPYPEVVAFADSLAGHAERLGAARAHGFAVTLRGEARLLSGRLDDADADLAQGARLNRAIGAATGEALALQRRAEVAWYRGQLPEAQALAADALAVACESDVGYHLLDRVYGTRISAAGEPAAGLAAVEEAESAIRGSTETCPGCRITLAVPAAIASARAGDLERAGSYAAAAHTLARVVMHLPAWDAAVEEVRGHLARAAADRVAAAAHFQTAAAGFRGSGQPLDEARCATLAAQSA